MDADIERALQEITKLYDVWEMIEIYVDDSEEKVTAQKIIDRLIISNTQELVKTYRDTKKKAFNVDAVFYEADNKS